MNVIFWLSCLTSLQIDTAIAYEVGTFQTWSPIKILFLPVEQGIAHVTWKIRLLLNGAMISNFSYEVSETVILTLVFLLILVVFSFDTWAFWSQVLFLSRNKYVFYRLKWVLKDECLKRISWKFIFSLSPEELIQFFDELLTNFARRIVPYHLIVEVLQR